MTWMWWPRIPIPPTQPATPTGPAPRGSVTTVTPIGGVLPVTNLKSLDNWRAFVHQLVAVAVPVIVALNIATENVATAWVPFVLAIVDNVLSAGNTVDKLRRTIYAAVGVLQAGGLATMVLTTFAPDYLQIGNALLAVTSAFLARFYNPTTTLIPAVAKV